MTETELFAFGLRVLRAAEVAELGGIQGQLVSLGEKALGLSMAPG